MVKVFECHCLRCNHSWETIKPKKPASCPQCHRRNWWKPGRKQTEKEKILEAEIKKTNPLLLVMTPADLPVEKEITVDKSLENKVDDKVDDAQTEKIKKKVAFD